MNTEEAIMISAVCPVLNEVKYITNVLSFFAKAKPVEKELFIIDGGSIDGTKAIIKEWQKEHANIILVDNPNRYVPFALNIAIPKCKGKYIVRLDAHTEYAPDYFEKIIATFDETKANIVGGPMRAIGKTSFQKAVAIATSTVLGVGNSNFHFKSFRGFTESVYLGAWEGRIFSRTGMFDEGLIRNQDDEFHYRAKEMGFRIFQNPDIKSYYYPRKDISSLFKQYYQYGLFKPLVLQKVKSGIKFRHFVPSLFVLYLCSFPLSHVFPFWNVPLLLYICLISFFSYSSSPRLNVKLNCLLVYPAIHLAYGLGFIRGLLRS